jgi:hypothetical protein
LIVVPQYPLGNLRLPWCVASWRDRVASPEYGVKAFVIPADDILETITMLSTSYRINRVQQTLRRIEADIPLLNMRVKDLSAERQKSARQFAEALVLQARAELNRLLEEQPEPVSGAGEVPCEPAD